MDSYAALVIHARSHPAGSAARNEAFNELATRFRDMAYRAALSILGDSQQAEDVVQDAFLSAYQHIDQLRDPEAFPGWLRSIVRTQCNRRIRRRMPLTEPIVADFDPPAREAGPEAILEQRELTHTLYDAVGALPLHERTVTEMFYFDGESQQDIADQLSVPLTTVKKRLQYARQRLRVIIADALDLLVPPRDDDHPSAGLRPRREGTPF